MKTCRCGKNIPESEKVSIDMMSRNKDTKHQLFYLCIKCQGDLNRAIDRFIRNRK